MASYTSASRCPQCETQHQRGSLSGTLQTQSISGKNALGLSVDNPPYQLSPVSGLQAKMVVGASNDPFEHEADRVAAQVMNTPSTAPHNINAVTTSPIARQAFVNNNDTAPAPDSVKQVLRTTGEPLSAQTRNFFEPRFGHDFAQVRVHRDAAASASARAIGAQAYTVQNHLVFGPKRYAPESVAGKTLLAHELTHVVQQRGGGASQIVQRAEDEAETDLRQLYYVAMEVTTDPDYAEHNQFYSAFDDTRSLQLGTAYPGDVVVIRGYNYNSEELVGEISWTLSAQLEQVNDAGDGAVQVRVSDSAASGSTLSVGITDAGGVHSTLKIAVGELPEHPEAVNPEFSRIRNERKALRSERRSKRRAFWQLPRQDRKTQRAGRRSERRDLRRQARDLRRESRALRRSETCSEGTQITIQAALGLAIANTNLTLGRLRAGGALSDTNVSAALGRYMRWVPAEPQSAPSLKHLNRIIDTLVVARNSMTLAQHGDFICTMNCEKTTGAYIKDGSRKQGSVDSGLWICPTWITGRGLRFPVARGLENVRAYALLHEFMHKSGPAVHEEDRFYVGRNDWQTVNASDALGFADGYAALVWTLANNTGAGA
jgi:Domain of unknown function (DUF4157)